MEKYGIWLAGQAMITSRKFPASLAGILLIKLN